MTDHATTNSSGLYLFTEASGTYTVTVDASNFTGSGALVGYNASPTLQGSDRTVDSNPNPSGTTPGTLPGGSSDLTVDFGYYKNVTIGDFVWNDLNANGIQNSGEPGIQGVTLTLTGTNGAGAAVTDHATTNSSGLYLFTEAPGTYTVTVDASNFAAGGALAGFTATPTLVGADRSVDSNPSPSGTTPSPLPSGGIDLTVDFGYFGANPKIAIVKLTNGTNNDSAPGVIVTPGSTVTWTYDVTNPGNEPIANVVVTDDNGTPGNPADDFHPTFVSGDANSNGKLDPGETWVYTASAIAQAGQYTNNAVVTGTSTVSSTPVTAQNPDNYFGFTTLASISGAVFADSKNGQTPLYGVQQPGEPGIPGVQMTLLNNTGSLVGTTTTDTNGNYKFTGLNAGTYTIVEGIPSPVNGVSYIHVTQIPGSTGGTTGDRTITTTVPAGVSSTGNNFAEFLPFDGHTGLGNIGSNFNGTAIAFNPVGQDNYIWFNSVLKVSGLSSGATTTMLFVNQHIDFTVPANSNSPNAGKTFHLSVPNSRLTFDPSVTALTATTTFDTKANEWEIRVPTSGISGNVFLSGLAFKVPAGGLPGGINPVTWSGNMIANAPNVSVNWQWAAAVYNNFSSDNNALGVKPLDMKTGQYNNSDHAGTPENFTIPGILPGGARGGGSNWTGSYSGTGSVTPTDPPIDAIASFSERLLLAGSTAGQANGPTVDTSTPLYRNAAAVFAPSNAPGQILSLDHGPEAASVLSSMVATAQVLRTESANDLAVLAQGHGLNPAPLQTAPAKIGPSTTVVSSVSGPTSKFVVQTPPLVSSSLWVAPSAAPTTGQHGPVPVTVMSVALAPPASPDLPVGTGNGDRGVVRLADALPKGLSADFPAPTTVPAAELAAGGPTVGQWLWTNFPSVYGEDGTSLQDLTGYGLGEGVFHIGAVDIDLADPGLTASASLVAAILTTCAVLKTPDEKKRASRVQALDDAIHQLYA